MQFKIEKKLKDSLGRVGVIEDSARGNTYSGFCGCGHQGDGQIFKSGTSAGRWRGSGAGEYLSFIFAARR